MEKPRRKVEWLVWGGIALTILTIAVAFLLARLSRMRAGGEELPVISQVPELTLTNQFGQPVNLAELRGQVWVADIIFTRCPGPCAEMTRRMGALQARLPADQPVKLVSLTTDPGYDTPAVLKRYGERFAADPNRWQFLTGTTQQIAQVAIDGLKLAALEKPPDQRTSEVDLFIHSTRFVLVDKQGRVRATFDTDEPDFQSRLLRAIEALLREKPGQT